MKIIIIGVNEWQRYTLPCIQSLLEVEPDADILVVDNGSVEPYPEIAGVSYARLDTTVSYAEALNDGIICSGNQDWYIVLNNDVLFHKPFIDRVKKLADDTLYGFYTHEIGGRAYQSGWCLFIPNLVYDVVGLFDEAFKPMWMEDADYSFRTLDYGLGMASLDREDWGIEHLASKGERLTERNEYLIFNDAHYKKNLQYLVEKHKL